MKTEMLVPKVNTNDDELEVLQWWVEDKEFVKKGQDIVDLESSKAAIAVESETSGYILKHCQTGDTINVGTPLATFYSDLSELESDLINDGNSQANQTLPVISQKSTIDASASKTVDSLVLEECDWAKPTLRDRPLEVAPVSAESLQEQTDIHNLCEQVPPAAIPSLPYIEQQKFRESELKENKGTLNCTRFSKSARDYINHHNIDTSRFEGMGLVTVEVIQNLLGLEQSLTVQPSTVQLDGQTVALKDPIHGLVSSLFTLIGTVSAIKKKPKSIKISKSKKLEIKILTEGQSGNITSSVTVQFKSSTIRQRLKELGLTNEQILPIILFETACLLENYPALTAYYEEEHVYYYDKVNIGLAIDLDQGLKVPIIRNANKLLPYEISEAIADYASRYLSNQLFVEDMKDGTITVTDLSNEGILHFQPLISEKQSAILGIGGDRTLDGYPMTLTLVFDHRVLAGREVAQFLNALKKRLLSIADTPTDELKKRFGADQVQDNYLLDQVQDNYLLDQVQDNYLEDPDTLPDWFYRKIWRRKQAVSHLSKLPPGLYLVFLDRLGLGTFICAELERLNRTWVSVEEGANFAKLADNRYCVNPNDPEHYQRLLESLAEDNLQVEQILHLWTYDEYAGEAQSLSALEQIQEVGVYSLLYLVQSLAKIGERENPIQLQVISSYIQSTSITDQIAYAKAPVLGLIKTISQEISWLKCRNIDLPVDRAQVNSVYILQEFRNLSNEQEVAYRQGQRLIPRLEKVNLLQEQKQEIPFKRGGMYLLSGGLGGIGVEIAKYLLKTYEAKLILVGRTSLPPRNIWESHLEQSDVVSERIKAYLELEKLGGEIIYETVDICDLTELQQAVEQAQFRFSSKLDGVIHLAGIIQECLLVETTKDSFAATLRPKVFGTWSLSQLVKNKPNSFFISFAAANSFFGVATLGAYAAGNSFIDSFSHYLRYQCSMQSYCFTWSMWDELGMSRGYPLKELSRSLGYYVIAPMQGIYSMLAGLLYEQGQLLIGLDGSKHYIRRYTETKSYGVQKLCAYFSAVTECVNRTELHEFDLRDRFGTKSSCDFIQLQEMPLLADGTVNRSLLMKVEDIKPQQQQISVIPQTEVEKTIASIWQEVLSLDGIGIYDNFFDIGGSSLLLVQANNKLREALKREISIKDMFQYPTIRAMAKFLSTEVEGISSDQISQSQSRGEKRRQKFLQQRRK